MNGYINGGGEDEINLEREKCVIGITVDENSMMRKIAMGSMTIESAMRVMYMLREAADELEIQISHRIFKLGENGNYSDYHSTMNYYGELSGGNWK
jgi:hypothetical protein